MRFVLVTAVIALIAGLSVTAAPDPLPAASPDATPHHVYQQVTRKELLARAKHPQFFQRDTTPSGGTCYARRSFENGVDHVLDARDAASLLLGGGSFSWENGTIFTDEHFIRDAKVHEPRSTLHEIYNSVKDGLTSKALTLTIPQYKRFKNSLYHGQLVHLSAGTAVRAQHLDEMIGYLLADPNFTEVRVRGLRIPREWFEVATSY